MTCAALTRAGGVVALCALVGGCSNWFGDENTAPAQFEVVVVNNSDQPVYQVFEDADAVEPAGRFSATRPNDESAVRVGIAKVGDEPGGCFDRNLWIVVSRSGQQYEQGDISEYADDLEIVRHFEPGECTDQEQIVVTYDG